MILMVEWHAKNIENQMNNKVSWNKVKQEQQKT